MKKILTIAVAAAMSMSGTAKQQSGGYPITPVPFTSVKVTDHFWGQRLEASRSVTIPLAFSKCEETGRYTNFSDAAKHLKDPKQEFPDKAWTYTFDDTDPYKTIEGASYLLQTYPNAKYKGKSLKLYIDSVINVIGSAQEPDGYLYTARTKSPSKLHEWAGDSRWSKEEDLSHELYNLGHMIEGAIAHYQATGSTKFLNIAKRFADCVCREVGAGSGQSCVVPGHQIAEMALCKLYVVTGEKKYLDEAKFFLDYRGKTTIQQDYSQSHKPVISQDEAVGHAVRAAYMYAGMADVAALTGDKDYIKAIDAIWDNIVSKKMYITGGIGSTSSGEAFGDNYQLPNMSAYCETCAAIGNVYVNYRLFLLHGDSKYYDVLERSLYNGLISGVSLDGGGFFYPNPLESMGQHQRQPWFGCACCPSNICRFIPSVPGYIYAVKDNNLYVNLFMSDNATVNVNGKKVSLSQTTEYPWDGDIAIKVGTAAQFGMKVRIPGWVRNQVVPSDLYHYSDLCRLGYTITVNGKAVDATIGADGYVLIDRKWKKGDTVRLHFDMQPRTVKANGLVDADKGLVAIERGPVVYCAEWCDNDFDVASVLINQNPQIAVANTTLKILGTDYPVVGLTTDGQTLQFDKSGRLTASDVKIKLIPYYAWCHRGSGKMRVWLTQDLSASTPAQQPTLASKAKVTSSSELPALSSINDRLVPKNADDRSIPYTHWWPKKNTTEWIAYEFQKPSTVQTSTVYWFDDSPWGGCRVPKSWTLYYKDANGSWMPVSNPTGYGTAKGVANTVNFDPVTTSAMKIEVVLDPDNSGGLYEWSVR